MIKKLPIDVSDIETMITGDYIYVDKTKEIYDLITRGRLYFLSRPRRFGKSLLLSTLREIFSGNKKLFENLWIGKSAYGWPKHPVINLDFTQISHTSANALSADLCWTLEDIARNNGITIEDVPSLVTKLHSLVSQLSARGRVVVLVDEYDYPLLRTLHSFDGVKPLRDVLSSFFAALKGLDSAGFIKAIFITGVTKFSKASIFSGMNTLNDISLDVETASLLGYTEEEIHCYFEEAIALFSQKKGCTGDAIIKEMTTWYNGYTFSESSSAQKVYNPFSILYYLQKQQLENYWFESGTPTFLIELIRKHYSSSEYHEALQNIVVSRKSLGAFDVESKLPLHTLLFQTGYLTIKSYDPGLRAYTLGCPNEEVRLSLSTYLVAMATCQDHDEVDSIVFALLTALNRNDLDVFCKQLQSLLATIPYDHYVNNESYFHSLFHLLTTLLGLDVQSEIHTSVGRIDLTLKTKTRLFIFEFKFNASGRQALQQIQDQRYYEKYRVENKPITLVGISFNYDEKKLTLDWVTKDIT